MDNMNNIEYDVEQFINYHPNKQISILIHSSVVQEHFDQIKAVFNRTISKENVFFYLPENSVYELRLLSQYSSFPIYQQKANYLLNNCSTQGAWSLNDIYIHKNLFLSSYHCDIALFIFCEPAAAEEFSRCMGKHAGVYILSYDPYRIYDSNQAFSSGSRINRPCKPLNNTQLQSPYKSEDRLSILASDGTLKKTLIMSQLETFHGGGEAQLFTSSLLPGKLLKIYKYSPGDITVKKLKRLISFNRAYSGCVLPTELIYRNGKCVGYTMDKINGHDLGCVLSELYDDSKWAYPARQKRLKELIRDISTILLELRMAQFVITDFSSGNIFVESSGKVRIIDCDGMEFYEFPGGGVTPPYGHPDITEDYFYRRLRTANQVNFSYAVLLFEMLLGWKNPLTQKGLGDADPEWSKNRFPYTKDKNGNGISVPGIRTNDEKLKVWCQQTIALRDAFEKVFTFQTTYDIGEWLRIIEIL